MIGLKMSAVDNAVNSLKKTGKLSPEQEVVYDAYKQDCIMEQNIVAEIKKDIESIKKDQSALKEETRVSFAEVKTNIEGLRKQNDTLIDLIKNSYRAEPKKKESLIPLLTNKTFLTVMGFLIAIFMIGMFAVVGDVKPSEWHGVAKATLDVSQ